MPEPTAAELAKEAEQEAAVFSQAVNVEKLLNMLRALDPAKDNLADNEEIQVCFSQLLPICCCFVIADGWNGSLGIIQGEHGIET